MLQMYALHAMRNAITVLNKDIMQQCALQNKSSWRTEIKPTRIFSNLCSSSKMQMHMLTSTLKIFLNEGGRSCLPRDRI